MRGPRVSVIIEGNAATVAPAVVAEGAAHAATGAALAVAVVLVAVPAIVVALPPPAEGGEKQN